MLRTYHHGIGLLLIKSHHILHDMDTDYIIGNKYLVFVAQKMRITDNNIRSSRFGINIIIIIISHR